MSVSFISNSYSIPAVTAVEAPKAAINPRGQEQFNEMVYSRTMEMEKDQALVDSERLFADELVKKLAELDFSDAKLLELVEAIKTFDFDKSSILQDSNLPYMALEALRRGLLDPEHGQNQVATILHFWGARQYIAGAAIQTVSLFNSDGQINPKFEHYIYKTLLGSSFSEDDKDDAFIANLRKLPASEQQFLLIPDVQGDNPLLTIVQKNGGDAFKTTISQIIKGQTTINAFNRLKEPPQRLMRMVPSVGMMQAFLDAQYAEPVQIKPRVYLSTEMQIRECGRKDTRDMMMPFPDSSGQSRCPPKADGFLSPGIDFTYHDFYHAIIASAIGKFYREAGITVADAITLYAKEPNVESAKGLEQMATLFYDVEYNLFFENYNRTQPESLTEVFWNSIHLEFDRHDLRIQNDNQQRRLGFDVPFDAARISYIDHLNTLEMIHKTVIAWKKTKGVVDLDEQTFAEVLIKYKIRELRSGTTQFAPDASHNARAWILIYAAGNGRVDVVQKVLEIDPTISREKAVKIAVENGFFNIVQELLKNNASISGDVQGKAVIEAAKKGHLNIFLELLNNGPISEEDRGIAVEQAIRSGSPDIFQALLNNGPISLEARGNAVCAAAGKGNLKVVQELLKNDAVISDWSRGSAFSNAAEKGHLEILHLLRKNNAVIEEIYLRNGILWAISQGHLPVIKYVLKDKVNLNQSFLKSSLEEATQGGHYEAVAWVKNYAQTVLQMTLN